MTKTEILRLPVNSDQRSFSTNFNVNFGVSKLSQRVNLKTFGHQTHFSTLQPPLGTTLNKHLSAGLPKRENGEKTAEHPDEEVCGTVDQEENLLKGESDENGS